MIKKMCVTDLFLLCFHCVLFASYMEESILMNTNVEYQNDAQK